MSRYSFKREKHCRWCGTQYYAVKPHGKDGFCKTACKQAHYRARKKYVTGKTGWNRPGPAHAVTQKKKKRKGR